MASLREIRRKIKSIKNTRQITRAMKMVATARLRRAQHQILSARPFAQRMQELVSNLSARIEAASKSKAILHPFFKKRESNEEALMIVTADRGLCGSFNTNLIRRGTELLKEKKEQSKTIHFFTVGRKGRDFFRRLYPMTKEYVHFFSKLSSVHADLIGRDLIELYLENPISKVTIVYQTFVSVLQQRVTVEALLPLDSGIVSRPPHPSLSPQRGERTKVRGEIIDYLYEPAKEEILKALLPRYLKGKIYRILLESYAAELGARMNAMENATRNASELIDALTLSANKTRQAMITKEIAELVGSGEAVS